MLQQDSETRSTRERHAVDVVKSLVERIGRWEVSEGVPRQLRRQQWSMFNVPIMWDAASGDRSCGVLQWVAQAAQDLSIPVCGSDMTGSEAVFAGWEGLQSAMNLSRRVVGVDPLSRIFATSLGSPFLREGTGTHSQYGHQTRIAVLLCWRQHTFRSFWDFAREEIWEPSHRRPVKGENRSQVLVCLGPSSIQSICRIFSRTLDRPPELPIPIQGQVLTSCPNWLWRHALKRSPGKMQSWRSVHGSCSVFCR